MKITIITVCFNSAATIRNTIESVLSQTYPDIEHIIVDGASKDNTMAIVNEYKDRISKIISEPDKGIYDAMNKGLALASGDIIGILNSDDIYADTDVLAVTAENFINSGADCVFGDLVYVDAADTDRVVRYWKSAPYKKGAFRRGWHPPHPAFFVKREIYQKYGVFDTSLRIASDFEIMLRFLVKYKIKSKYFPKIVVKMRTGGESNRNFRNIIIANWECQKAFQKNQIPGGFLAIWAKPLSKLTQYLQKPRK
jgi:glycosyltransferase